MAKGIWLVQKRNDPARFTQASFYTEQEAEAWAKKWMNDYIIIYFEDT